MNIMTLMTNLSNVQTLLEGAQLAVDSNLTAAKDVYLAWGKEKGAAVKDLNSAWKEAQPEKVSSGVTGWQAAYFEWLAAESRTEQEALDYLMAQSDNVKKHASKHMNIWALCETVRKGSAVQRTLAATSGEPKKSANKAVAQEEIDPTTVEAKEYRKVIEGIAKGEYKTVTVIRNQLKVLKDDELAPKAKDILWAIKEFAAEKGVKVDDIKAKAIELLNK